MLNELHENFIKNIFNRFHQHSARTSCIIKTIYINYSACITTNFSIFVINPKILQTHNTFTLFICNIRLAIDLGVLFIAGLNNKCQRNEQVDFS